MSAVSKTSGPQQPQVWQVVGSGYESPSDEATDVWSAKPERPAITGGVLWSNQTFGLGNHKVTSPAQQEQQQWQVQQPVGWPTLKAA